MATMIERFRVSSYQEWLKILTSDVTKKTLYSFEGGLVLREPGKIYYTFRVKLSHGTLKFQFFQQGLNSEGSVSKEKFFQLLKEYHPDCMEWFLFNTEWMS